MAAKKSKTKRSHNDTPKKSMVEEEQVKMEITLEAIDAISDDDDDDNDEVNDDDDDAEDEEASEEYNKEVAALRQMISDGKFNVLLDRHSNPKTKSNQDEVDEVDVSEDEVENVSHENDEECGGEDVQESEDGDSSDDGNENDAVQTKHTQSIALTSAIQSVDRHLPFSESFAVIPHTPLPFRSINYDDDDDDDMEKEENIAVDIHDDLKRETTFYEHALEGVHLAREQCEKCVIPFRRPDDFFAEMVKSDDHMAKIKDRLIFETKKIEAVERHKSNKEQTLMAKERHAHRLAEKSKAKKAHMSAVEDWKRSAESGRGRLGGKVVDVQEEEERLRGMSGKRNAADKKYGFGGKRGRFKQNDRKSLDDMSGFKPKGGFGGVGQKSGGGVKKGGTKRAGKRARDASRSGR